MARKNTRSTRTARKATVKKMDAAQAIAIAKTSAKKAVDAVAAQLAKTREAAISKATDARDAAVATATEARTRTVDAVSQLEKVFEQRVSRAIAKLGVPTQKEVRALARQVAQLQAKVDGKRRAAARRAA